MDKQDSLRNRTNNMLATITATTQDREKLTMEDLLEVLRDGTKIELQDNPHRGVRKDQTPKVEVQDICRIETEEEETLEVEVGATLIEEGTLESWTETLEDRGAIPRTQIV